MFDFSKPFGNAALLLLVSAVLHIAVILVSGTAYLAPMIMGAILWTGCAYLLGAGNRWIAGIIFVLALFIAATVPLSIAATVPLSIAVSGTGLVSALFYAITLADLGAAIALFLALWRNAAAA